MKRLIGLLVVIILAITPLMAQAEDVDFSAMTPQEWCDYEWFMDVSEIYTDCVCYDYAYLRETLLPLHEQAFAAVVYGAGELSDDEKRELLQKWEDARLATPKIAEPEELRIYLWPEGGMPSVTEYPTEKPAHPYGDAADFVPFMYECLVDESVQPKGAVLLCAGGGFNSRCNIEEAYASALALNELGYQCFIVNYRIAPWGVDEAALDLQRAVRMVRADAEKYRINPDNIAAGGFSAGGFAVLNAANKFYGDINASSIVEGYVPDEIDAVNSDINAVLSIYASMRGEFVNPNFPATFFVVGGNDGMFAGVVEGFAGMAALGMKVELHTFAGAPHGFGAGMTSPGVVYENTAAWPALADAFMQDVYATQAQAE